MSRLQPLRPRAMRASPTRRDCWLNVTSGPGSINALNGVFPVWTDWIPMLFALSGQVKRETCMVRTA